MTTTATDTTVTVGTLATTGCGGDCYPAIVTEVSASGKAITVNSIEHILVHDNGTTQRKYGDWYKASEGHLVLGDASENGTVYTLRKNGEWIPKGRPMSDGHLAITLGDAIYRQNPSF